MPSYKINALLPQSLSSRLSLYYALAFFLILTFAFTLLYFSIKTIIDARIDDDLTEDIQELTLVLQEDGMKGIIEEIEEETAGGGYAGEFMYLYNAEAIPVYTSDDQHWQDLPIDEEKIKRLAKNQGKPELITLDLDSQDASTRVVYGSISSNYVLIIGESREEQEDIMEIMLLSFAGVFLLAIPFALLLVWYLTRHAVRGIEAVSHAAQQIRNGKLDQRVDAHNQLAEVQNLADTFDTMADRIQSLIRNMQDVTDNIAHDLRSPLGRIRLLSESALKPNTNLDTVKTSAKNTIIECDRLVEMINTSLDVAETEAGVARVERNHLNIGAIVQDAFELFEPSAELKNIKFDATFDKGCFIHGDTMSLQRMFANVLDNAIKYTPCGQSVRVTLSCADDQVRVSISDTGLGIASSDLENIFDRFYRVDQSRSSQSCGLGLSYARAVARAHGGNITVTSHSKTDNKSSNTEFVITLPKENEQPNFCPPYSLSL